MGLDQLRNAEGRYAVLAIDHRDSLRLALQPDDPDSVSVDQIVDFKLETIRTLSPRATGVMLEPEYSIPIAIESGALADGVGFFAALEAQGYLADPGAGPTRLMPNFGPHEALAAGASACKLLLHYNPSHQAHAREQERIGAEVVEACREAGAELMVEPLFFGLDADTDRRAVVIETTRRMTELDADLLKMPFPLPPDHTDEAEWAEACAEITELARQPWTLLSAGVSFDTFARQYAVAAANGCVGFMVGRALWSEALNLVGPQRSEFLTQTATARFAQLAATTH